MLGLGDLATIIRLIEIEIFELQKDLNGSDPEASDNAAEIIIHTDNLAIKLEEMYKDLWEEESGYPKYEELVSDYKNYPPFV